MIKLLMTVIVFFSINAMSAENENSDVSLESKTLTPSIRVVERDWEYFSNQSCDLIHQFIGHTQQEKKLIIKRKKQCMNKYKAFLPKTITR